MYFSKYLTTKKYMIRDKDKQLKVERYLVRTAKGLLLQRVQS